MNGHDDRALLFFDIDGTLVWRDVEAAKRGENVPRFDKLSSSPAVYDAFERLHERGHLTCICTGRSFCQIQQSLLDLEPNGWIVEAGSYVSFGDKVLRDVRINVDLLFATVSELSRLGIDAEFESNESLLGFYPTLDAPRFPDFPVAHTVESFMSRGEGLSLAKFCVHDSSNTDASALLAFARGRYKACDLSHDVMEFSLLGCNRGSAIQLVFDYLGRGQRQSFAFGDSENDLPMADVVDRFVALGNALEQVKQRASIITLPVWDDGEPVALETLGLI